MFLSLRGVLPFWPFRSARQVQAELSRQVTDLQALHELSTRLLEARTLSQQLSVLREERLVSTRREGKQIFYRIDSDAALAVMQVLYQQFCLPPNGGRA